MDYSKGICNICYGNLNAGALFTAECSHIFHYNCIFHNLQNGSRICPTCNSSWTQVPFQFPQPPIQFAPTPHWDYQPRPTPTVFDPNFDDDEPLPSSVTSSSQTPTPPEQGGGAITVKALPEYPALSKSDKSDSFAVLVSIRAPMLSAEAADMGNARAPLDLVAVLDVSGSMYGHKIGLLKQAVNFVIKNLGPKDRLSIVTFSTDSRRLTPLKRMTEVGQTDTSRAVSSIRVGGSTNIIAGLQTAVKVLEQRREKNPVTSIILLSEGQDTDNRNFISCLSRLPQSIRSNAVGSDQKAPPSNIVQVYTFGFGADHDAKALHAISDGSGGTFSYIEAIEVIQDAFAQCIGGLLSVVAQEVEIQVHSGSRNVTIKSIPSGRYRNTVDSFGSQHGVVYVGDVYADEEKHFLVYLSVPEVEEVEGSTILTTKLLEVKCSYKSPLTQEKIESLPVRAEIRRPLKEALSEEDKRVCLEVDREKNRILIAEGISEAQEMAERGELAEGRSVLEEKRKSVLQSFAGQAGDAPTMSLFGQAGKLQECMATNQAYVSGGRAFGLSTQSSHMYQRAAAQALHSHEPTVQPQPQLFSAAFAVTPTCSPATFSFANSCTSISAAAPSSTCFGSAAPSPTTFSFSCTSIGAAAPSSACFGSAAPSGAAFGYQTAYMQHMVRKSQQERQSSGQNSFSFGSAMGSSENP